MANRTTYLSSAVFLALLTTGSLQADIQNISLNNHHELQVTDTGGDHRADLTGLQTDQGNTNATDIATNTANIYHNTNSITNNQGHIQQNTTQIADNQNTIKQNAGGAVNGTTIRSNKDLTADVYTNRTDIINLRRRASAPDNSRQVAHNANRIQTEHTVNTTQQLQINDLYGQTDTLQMQVNGLETQLGQINRDILDLGEFTADVAAGSMAVSAIDFGTVQEGHYSLGIGIGYGKGDYAHTYDSWAGALGIKYGIGEISEDVTLSLDAKGWVSNNGNVAAGAGAVFDF